MIAGLLLTLPFTLAPTPCSLYVCEYPGSSEKVGRANSSDIFAIEHKLFVPFDSATGQASGARVHTPLTVVKQIDKATPGFHKALVTGQNLSEVILRWYRIDPFTRSEAEYYRITLRNARIVTMETFMPMSFLPENESFRHMEKVSFVYEEIEWNWLPDSIIEVDRWLAFSPALPLLPTVPCDLDGNGSVNERDFAIFLAAFGHTFGEPGYDPASDFDGNGVIDIVDYELWFQCYRDLDFCNPPASPPAGTLGDFNADGDLDMADFAYMQRCMPTPDEISFPCIIKFDFNGDQIVNRDDHAEFIFNFTGP